MRKTQTKRIQLGNYLLPINPESYSQDERTIFNAQHTAGGGYFEHWGADFPRITFSGITGSGRLDELKKFRDQVRTWNKQIAEGAMPTLVEFHNYTDDEHAEVAVVDFRLKKSINRPTMYGYDAELVIFRWIGDGYSIKAATPMAPLEDTLEEMLSAPRVVNIPPMTPENTAAATLWNPDDSTSSGQEDNPFSL